MSLSRIYVVSDGKTERLVRAVSGPRAIAHVVQNSYSAHVASQDDMVRLLPGRAVEVAGEIPTTNARPEPETATSRDDGALYDLLILLPEEVTGLDGSDDTNLSIISQWTDAQVAEAAAYATAALDKTIPDEAVPPVPAFFNR